MSQIVHSPGLPASPVIPPVQKPAKTPPRRVRPIVPPVFKPVSN